MGRVTSTTKTITGDTTPYTTQNEYDLSGKPTRITYPDSFWVDYAYYAGTGLLHTVTGSDGVEYAENTLYEPTGKIGQIDYHNDTATRYTYDSWSTKLLGIATDAHSNPIQTKAYYYSRAGDITSIEDQQTGITYNYTYDKLHRLLTETNTGTYAPITYTYSAIGNISSKVIGTNTFTYAYSLSAHKHAVSKITLNGTNYSYTYDVNGNMTKGYDFTDLANIATRNITYNADNMPVQVTHTRYGTTNITYDAAGGRAKKVSPSGTTYYIGEHFEKINGQTIKYIFAGDMRIAKITSSNTYYFHKDHLGSSTIMTDSSGNVVETTNYMPFGETRVHTGSTVTNYKFTDQELDPETGLYYYGARYYDPVIGRFISADSIVPDFLNPQTLNRYSYCLNNPLIYTDPSGHFMLGRFLKSFVSGIVGGAVAVLTGGAGAPLVLAAMAGGAAAGATHAALSGGNLESILQSAVIGGMLGGIGGGLYVAYGMPAVYGMLGAGAAYSVATGGLDSLAYYAGGIAGGIAGAYGTQYAMDNWFAGEVGDGIGSTQSIPRSTRLIKGNIDGVEIDYTTPKAENPVDSVLADRFESAVSFTKNGYPGLNKLTISATTNAHRPPSLHVKGFAIDIARVNGIKIGAGYGRNPFVTSVVKSLQTNLGGAYENYGPALMIGPRAASDYLIRSHQNHIHYSIKP